MTTYEHSLTATERHTDSQESLFVPCRVSEVGIDVLVTGHLPDGTRTGIAFTSPEAVSRAMGESQTWIRLSCKGLRAVLRARGITHLQVDPDLVAPNPLAAPEDRSPPPSRISVSGTLP